MKKKHFLKTLTHCVIQKNAKNLAQAYLTTGNHKPSFSIDFSGIKN